jgi:hypothetical protein
MKSAQLWPRPSPHWLVRALCAVRAVWLPSFLLAIWPPPCQRTDHPVPSSPPRLALPFHAPHHPGRALNHRHRLQIRSWAHVWHSCLGPVANWVSHAALSNGVSHWQSGTSCLPFFVPPRWVPKGPARQPATPTRRTQPLLHTRLSQGKGCYCVRSLSLTPLRALAPSGTGTVTDLVVFRASRRERGGPRPYGVPQREGGPCGAWMPHPAVPLPTSRAPLA